MLLICTFINFNYKEKSNEKNIINTLLILGLSLGAISGAVAASNSSSLDLNWDVA